MCAHLCSEHPGTATPARELLIDTHCHLDCALFEKKLDVLLTEARVAGVFRWIVPSVHPSGWKRLEMLAIRYSALRPAYGIHPEYAGEADTVTIKRLEQLAARGVAVGETGLDRLAGNINEQERLFRQQIGIARQHGLPLLIHCNRMTGRTLTILKEEKAFEVGGIMHAFSGSVESAREFVQLGFAISVSGNIARANARKVRQLAVDFPLKHLVIETDAPYMPSCKEPGQLHHPAELCGVAGCLAELKGCSFEDIARATRQNAQSVISGL